ncbi:O-antigen ligase family protein [Polynucleobacter victoriensis]|uniref:O-antigen ligase n=1 Tax=Polynucleobacter victoriensis TaxID=2049319 RepID=A0A212T7X3_9BURK|nr:O-antigen ligase family protein [Polynucleobacter victoriensis]SNC62119.1 O-antigen ligase [Polynucleobacter victoriensis]
MNTPAVNSLEAKQLKLAQLITIGLLIALFFSAPAVNFFEALLVITVITSKFLRARLVESLRSPLCIAVLLFYGIIIFSATYSIAPPNITWGMVNGWRKILILPFAYAAIFSSPQKELLVKIFLITSAICLIWSFLSYLFPEKYFYTSSIGIVIKNHATQGIFFAIAIFLSLPTLAKNKSLLMKILSVTFIILLLLNITTITTGRSGYLATLVLILLFTLHKINRTSLTRKIIFLTLICAITTALFLSAQTSRERIKLGIQEFTQVKSEGDAGSMGVRYYWWTHSINMIKKNPLFGLGTGSFEEALNQEIKGLNGPAATKTNDPHNQYLKIAVEQGIIGLLVFLGIIFSAIKSTNVTPVYKLIGLSVLASWCATSLANSHFSTFHEGHFIWFWLGAMLSREEIYSPKNDQGSSQSIH